MSGFFTREYERKIAEGTMPNPFYELKKNINSIGRAKDKPRAVSTVESQVIEFSNYWNLNRMDTKTIRRWLQRLALHTNDSVGDRLIGEVKHDGEVRSAMSVLIWKIKQELPESFRGD